MTGLISCQKEETSTIQSDVYSLTVTIPQGIQTRAAADYGNGDMINRCILEIYRNDALYGERQIQAVTGNQVTFSNLKLVPSQTYEFVLWADCGDGLNDLYYNTSNLSKVTANNYKGNDDGFDAFFGTKTIEVTDAISENITLTRPFGQLSVKTNDIASITHADLKPTDVKVEFSEIPTSFNVRTGEVGDLQPVSYTTTVEDADAGELTIDYIWATSDKADLADFTMTFLNNGNTIADKNFSIIPIQRNYRTKVSGNLITQTGNINVTINPEFQTTPETLLEAATNGGSVTLQNDVIFDATQPAFTVAAGKTLILNLNGYSIKSTVANNDAIHVKGGTLIINGEGSVDASEGYYAIWATGDAHVTINGGNYVGNGSCIQANNNAHIEINDGYFKVQQPYNGVYFVVNLQDNLPNTITIKGGTFENCDPSNTNTEPAGVSDNFVAEGYSSIKISDQPEPFGTYQVVKE